jgi:predicted amidohydrolase
MKIALLQIASITGDLERNIARHLAALGHLRGSGAELAIFPELSLSNYEPPVAARAAIDAADERLAPFDQIAGSLGIHISVGAPLRTADKPSISAILFSPGQPRRVIHKAYLHDDEAPLFAPGCGQASVLALSQRVALAICFDISIDAHIEQAAAQGMDVYAGSVAKTAEGIAAARERLRIKARRYRSPVLVVNSVGSCEGRPAGGGSMVIDAGGRLVAALDDSEQAMLIYDLEIGRAEKLPLE